MCHLCVVCVCACEQSCIKTPMADSNNPPNCHIYIYIHIYYVIVEDCGDCGSQLYITCSWRRFLSTNTTGSQPCTTARRKFSRLNVRSERCWENLCQGNPVRIHGWWLMPQKWWDNLLVITRVSWGFSHQPFLGSLKEPIFRVDDQSHDTQLLQPIGELWHRVSMRWATRGSS